MTPEQGLDVEALEGILNRHGLHGTLDMLAAICADKADNGPDEGTARMWKRRAERLARFASLKG